MAWSILRLSYGSHEEVISCKSDISWDLGHVFPAVRFPPAAGLVLPVEGPAHGCRLGLRNCFREAPLSHSVITEGSRMPRKSLRHFLFRSPRCALGSSWSGDPQADLLAMCLLRACNSLSRFSFRTGGHFRVHLPLAGPLRLTGNLCFCLPSPVRSNALSR